MSTIYWWWSGYLKVPVEPLKRSLRRTADSRGGGTPVPCMDLDPVVYPSAGGLHSSVDLGEEGDTSVLTEVEMGPKWICFTGWAGRWPID